MIAAFRLRVLAAVLLSVSGYAEGSGVRFVFDGETGAIGTFAAADGREIASAFGNRYTLMSKSGDSEAVEREDVVVAKTEADGETVFVCTNPKLPGLTVTKRYRRENGGLRRTLAFLNSDGETKYVTPFTECRFAPSFQKDVWHLGAGYIGPYKPFPQVKTPRSVNEFRQSSKGLVFIHPDGKRGDFAHYRTKIDETVVLPWWHSTIGHYREYHDRLWYLPDGYRMGLGTFGLYKGKPVSVTEQFTAFDGGMFAFFDGVFAKDPDFAAELKAIPPPPAWIGDMFANVDDLNVDEVRWLSEMTDDGSLLLHLGPSLGTCYSWGDYRVKDGFITSSGGRATATEVKEHVDAMKAISPRVHVSIYNIIISTSYFTGVLREHPEWYRTLDRDGNRDSLFPGLSLNWQTMFCYPECRDWYVDMLSGFARDLGLDTIYIDETQMTNTIDWERDRVTRDDDTVKFWRKLVKRFHGGKIMFFANGSGNPYADLNYMESPHELAPARWRDWAGVGWGIGLMNRLRPGQRTVLLYWTPNVDYANRVLALGWIPRTHFNAFNDLPVMRAVYQSGNLLPIDAKYTPDWKTDAAVEVESHSVKREKAKDALLSFINRARTPADIPVKVDLGSLGFGKGERVNVWKMNIDFMRAGASTPELLSDKELKSNWRGKGIVKGARVTEPELVHSGRAEGEFAQSIGNLGTDKMEQFLVTASPLSFFAVDDLPLNYLYTENKYGKIDGNTVALAKRADVLLADRDFDFTGVTANGKPAKTRRVAVGGLSGTLVTLEPGEWTLAWKESPRKADAVEKAQLPVSAGGLFTHVAPPRRTYEPERSELKSVNVVRDGVRVSRAGVYVGKVDVSNCLQTNVPVSSAAADPDKLVLAAGTSRREAMVGSLENFAGFEMSGARQIRCRYTHTFGDAPAIILGHVAEGEQRDATHLRNPADKVFTGLVIDYRVNGTYVKRVAISTGLYSPLNTILTPPWGKAGKADETLDAGEWIDEAAERVFSLDVAKFAPGGWDGTAFLSLGTSRIKCGRAVKLEFLAFNDMKAADFVTPFSNAEARKAPPPLTSKALKSKPKSLREIDAADWKEWAKIDRFVKVGTGRLKADAVAYVAHDYEYLYVAVEASEPNRNPQLAQTAPEQNEHVEVLVRRPDNVTYQVIGDAKGQFAHYRDRKPSQATEKVVCRGEIVKGKGWRVFFALPIDALKFDMQRTPVVVRYAITRIRRNPLEYSGSAPLGGFFEYADYGTLILDFNW